MYLKKGKNFIAPESELNLWEVGVNRDGDQVVIREVGGYGPAHGLGLRAGDVVESINDCDVRRLSTWQIRRLFGREGRPLAAVVLRGTERLTLETGGTASGASDEEK
jgi:S1-C subfamily serine protease